MKTIRIILLFVYAMAAVIIFVTGLFYSELLVWSYNSMAMCGWHVILSLVVSTGNVATAGRIAAYCWHALSAVLCIGLLMIHALGNQGGWLLIAVGVAVFALVLTVVVRLVLKSDVAMGS